MAEAPHWPTLSGRAGRPARAGHRGRRRHRPRHRRRAVAARRARHRLRRRRRGAGRSSGRDCPSRRRSRPTSRDEADVDRLFDEVRRRSAGSTRWSTMPASPGRPAASRRSTPADWRRCIEVDLTGQFLCARRAVPLLKAAGGGSIVNMSSAAGRFGYAFRTPYSAAKWGVIGLTQSLAKELGPHNIRVNAILPGIVEGPRIERRDPRRAPSSSASPTRRWSEHYLEKVSLRRMVSPQDVAAMVAFLLSPTRATTSPASRSASAAMSRRSEEWTHDQCRDRRHRASSAAPGRSAFARAGHEVALWDPSPAAAGGGARLHRAACWPISPPTICCGGQAPDAVLRPHHRRRRLAEALAGAIHVQENTPENLEMKRRVFSA